MWRRRPGRPAQVSPGRPKRQTRATGGPLTLEPGSARSLFERRTPANWRAVHSQWPLRRRSPWLRPTWPPWYTSPRQATGWGGFSTAFGIDMRAHYRISPARNLLPNILGITPAPPRLTVFIHAMTPPSISRSVPVIHAALSLMRKATAPAISSGSPPRLAADMAIMTRTM